ncbi:glycosyltransferase [Agromyces sp. MMS17-SY077]|uniref:Glycosyltransferase n=1 Tax=Agromyces seonyuensis TaxID=2662446 RepID=A0A6I4P307_9MICO|nr:glycosyltransferase [Agromyces seonyuensis]
MTAVVTAFDQGELVADAVASVRRQTLRPVEILVVDDGSTDDASLAVLDRLAADRGLGCRVLHRPNGGVSAARNTGIAAAGTALVAVLDGDDAFAPTFLERTAALLDEQPELRAASSWLHAHGAIDAVVRPAGGTAVHFLHRNAAPAAVLLRRDAWAACGGYDESMRSGFEDWDFFLALLADGGAIGIVPEPLIEYRTAPASSNLRSMAGRLDRYGELIDRHRPLFERHLREALLALEARAIAADGRWEDLVAADPALEVGEVSYGDGGMAAAVRIATRRAARPTD